MASYAYTVGIQQMVISAIILTVTLAFLSDDHLNYFNEKLEKWSNLMWIILHLLLPTTSIFCHCLIFSPILEKGVNLLHFQS